MSERTKTGTGGIITLALILVGAGLFMSRISWRPNTTDDSGGATVTLSADWHNGPPQYLRYAVDSGAEQDVASWTLRDKTDRKTGSGTWSITVPYTRGHIYTMEVLPANLPITQATCRIVTTNGDSDSAVSQTFARAAECVIPHV